MITDTIRSRKSPINKTAVFQNRAFTITLPTEPSVIISTKNKELNIQTNIIVQEDIKDVKHNILELYNFIDTSKLLDQKKSKHIEIYELSDLKKFANLVGIEFNNVRKAVLIESIKNNIKEQIRGPNLIEHLKELNPKLQVKTLLKHIEVLFDKHEISENKKQAILSIIKDQLKFQVDPIKYVVHILENEWLK